MDDRIEKGLDEAEKFRNRGQWCRKLAAGAGNLNFASKLDALAREFEREAATGRADVSGLS